MNNNIGTYEINATEETDGEWLCLATNIAGGEEKKFVVTVLGKPYLKISGRGFKPFTRDQR